MLIDLHEPFHSQVSILRKIAESRKESYECGDSTKLDEFEIHVVRVFRCLTAFYLINHQKNASNDQNKKWFAREEI